MRPFKFKLQAVLELRARVEQERMLGLGEAQRACLTVEEAVRARQRSLAQAKQDLRERLTPARGVSDGFARGVNMADTRLLAAGTLSGVAQLRESALALAGAQERQERARAALAQAAARRMALERVRDQRRAQWAAQLARAEQAELDDVVNSMRLGSRGEASRRGV